MTFTPILAALLLLQTGGDQPLAGRTWTDEDGRTVTGDAWQGSPVLVAPFYRGCSLMCPRTVAKLRRVEAVFRHQGKPLEILMITLDPGSDPPAALRAYKRQQGLSAHWHLLNGPRAQVVAFCREYLGWTPMYDGDHVSHGTGCLLLDRRGRLARRFPGWAFPEAELPGSVD
jgi:cytochrome oxidase Cu insertion factor (SCO1/SenC/PrrC family)